MPLHRGSWWLFKELIMIETAILFIVVSLVLLLLRAMKGVKYNLEKLRVAIEALLRRGYNGGFLVIKVPYSSKFVQLRKYIHSPGKYGIELGFPRAKWSEMYFDDVFAYCKRAGLQPVLKDEIWRNSTMEFIYADFGRDIDMAHSCILYILIEILRVNEKKGFYALLERGSTKDILVDR
jgi:hypothetical protein